MKPIYVHILKARRNRILLFSKGAVVLSNIPFKLDVFLRDYFRRKIDYLVKLNTFFLIYRVIKHIDRYGRFVFFSRILCAKWIGFYTFFESNWKIREAES